MKQQLASLVMSSASSNYTSNSNGTSDSDAKSASGAAPAPFVLDASNSTKTQFYLVVNDASNGSIKPGASMSETLANLQSAASSKGSLDSEQMGDIQVSLQVPVFDPTKAVMTPFCATFDPNPPTPAPLTMEACFSNMEANGQGVSATDSAAQKSQTFAYNPASGVIRPMWLSSSSSSNSTGSNSTSGSGSNSTGTVGDAQMNFAVHDSIKDGSVSAPGLASNATQTVNGTLPSPPAGPQNVTMVFTPAEPAIQAVSNPSDVTSFAPGDASEDETADTPDDSTNASSATATTTDTDGTSSTSSDMPTITDSSASGATSGSTDSADVASSTSTSEMPAATGDDADDDVDDDDSANSMVAATSTVDEAEIEKMYQYPRMTESV